MNVVLLIAIAQLGAYIGLALRMVASGLFRAYPFFSSYIAFELIRSVNNLWIPRNTDVYAEVYFLTQPVAWILNALTVWEVFRATLKSHPGISTLGRRTLLIAVSCATAVAVLSLMVAANLPISPFTPLERYILLERVIYSSLLVLILTLVGFLAFFPVPLSRNAMWHASLFAGYLFIRTTLWIVRNMVGPEFTAALNMIMSGTVLGLVAAWTIVLTADGEKKTILSSRRADKAHEERLMAQLDRINATLIASGRK